MWGCLVCIIIFLNKVCCGDATDDIIVSLPEGQIRGHILHSGDEKEYYAFQEIPYAAPPTGENRFKEPGEPKLWKGIRDAVRNHYVCMQDPKTALTPIPNDMNMTEDCLFLNVYSPLKPGTTEALPVLFWIHGGGFFYGSGALQYYNPKYLMDYNIVVVTINYRMGPFGFLTTLDEAIPGNIGLKDQLLALKWVTKNIHLFGGNGSNITVMGESAGSTSTGFMQLSKQAKGLVSGYILMSGSPLSPYAYQDNARYYAFKLGSALNPALNPDDSNELLKVLLNASADDILYAPVSNDGYKINPIAATVIWLPVVENQNYANAYITRPMMESLAVGDFNQVPLMTGMTSEETFFFLRYLTAELEMQIRTAYDIYVNLTVNPKLNISPNILTQAGSEYKRIYSLNSFKEDRGAFVKYLSDEVFTTPNIRHAELASYKTPVYVYEFAYKGLIGGLANLPEIPGADNVGHTEDLHYLFGGIEGVINDIHSYPKVDRLTMKRMLKMWTNFVKYQNPTPYIDPLLQNVTWLTFNDCIMPYLSINHTLAVLENPKYYSRVKKVFDKYVTSPYYVY